MDDLKNSFTQLNKLLKTTCSILEEYDIKYSATCGTLLGLSRHKGIIPWDDDCDLCILEDEEYKLLFIKETLRKFGMSIIRSWTGYRVYCVGGTLKEDYYLSNHERYPFLDIFVYQAQPGESVYHYQQKHVRDLYPSEFIEHSMFESLVKYKCHDYHIFAFEFPEEYLKRVYKDWETPLDRYFSHITNLWVPLTDEFKDEASAWCSQQVTESLDIDVRRCICMLVPPLVSISKDRMYTICFEKENRSCLEGN